MQLDTITIDPAEAREKVTEYRAMRKELFTAEDARIARGYLEAAEGRPMIRLERSLLAGGLDDRGMPLLAVARADMPWCYLNTSRMQTTSRVTLTGAEDREQASNVSAADRVISVTFDELEPCNTWDERSRFDHSRWDGFRSQVPVVPPALRPTRGGLRQYHVLWEVDEWAKDPEPPVDPALIRRIEGDLWAVYGVWDLTELERAVIAGRR